VEGITNSDLFSDGKLGNRGFVPRKYTIAPVGQWPH
jgi:hypothetical protein